MNSKSTNNKSKLDIPRLNEVIKLGRNILKIFWVLLIFGIFLLVTFLFKELKLLNIIGVILGILSPLFIGLVIAWLLDPFVNKLEKVGIKRVLSVIFVFLLFVSATILFLSLIIPSLVNQINDFINITPNIIDNFDTSFSNFFNKLDSIYSFDFSYIQDSLYNSITGLFNSVTVDLPNNIINIATSIISGGLSVLVGLIIGFYMLFDFNNIRKNLLNVVPKKLHADFITLTDNLDKVLKNYVQGTLLITIILFVFQSIAFLIAGLSSPMLFGLFCAVTNLIPYFGPYIGGIPAVIVGFSINPIVGISTLIAVIIAQLLESYVLNPIVMSKTTKLHPVTIIVWLLIFAHFFGIIGMILATPVIACVKVLFTFLDEKYEIISRINR